MTAIELDLQWFMSIPDDERAALQQWLAQFGPIKDIANAWWDPDQRVLTLRWFERGADGKPMIDKKACMRYGRDDLVASRLVEENVATDPPSWSWWIQPERQEAQ